LNTQQFNYLTRIAMLQISCQCHWIGRSNQGFMGISIRYALWSFKSAINNQQSTTLKSNLNWRVPTWKLGWWL